MIDATSLGDGVYEIHDLIDKPDPAPAPSDLAMRAKFRALSGMMSGACWGLYRASIYFALKNPDLAPALRAYLGRVLLYRSVHDGHAEGHS